MLIVTTIAVIPVEVYIIVRILIQLAIIRPLGTLHDTITGVGRIC